ncbi:Bromodomain-containing protein, partial [Xylona heveae TC161]
VPSPPAAPAEASQPITPAQHKFLLHGIRNIKRTKDAFAFNAPVDPIKLNIPSYLDFIKKPMDLGTMEDKLKRGAYSSIDEYVSDFHQIVENTTIFNGAEHPVTKAAVNMKGTFDKQMSNLPRADVTEPTPAEKKAAKKASVSKASAARRDGDGRPKREIHPPPPRDLPYSSVKPKKKKYQLELRFCQEVVNEMNKPKYQMFAFPFYQPVDPVALNIPHYHKIIKKPMDLGTVSSKLKGGQYENAKEFESDVRLMFANCFKFNPPMDQVHQMGRQLEEVFNRKWDQKKEWIEDHTPASGPHSPGTSPEPEEEEEEEEEEMEEEEENEISILQKQIAAMSKQVEMIKKKSSPPAPTKKGVKSAKPAKKVGKKSATTVTLPAKVEKKAKPKVKKERIPYVTYEEKQEISNRINTLPESKMATALKIIRDNMPNLRGVDDEELELDIDELSNEVLYKLLTFVR